MPTMRRTPTTIATLTLGLLLGLSLLAGCGGKDDKKAATQVAARINGSEITVHQVNQILGRLPGVGEEDAPRLRQEIIEKLVDQQLAVEQAQKSKLDRQPDVMAAIEAARREVLARAYLEQIVAAKGMPTAEEARRYFAEHPELFAQRRIYTLQEIAVEKDDALLPALKEKAAAARNLEEIIAWLKDKGARFSLLGGTRPAEQIPFERLPTLHAARDGQIVVLTGAQDIGITRVVSSQTIPIDEATALPRIQQFLANQRRKDLIESEIGQLRQQAKIEYLGDFGPKAAAATAATAQTPAPPAPQADTGNVGKAIGGLK